MRTALIMLFAGFLLGACTAGGGPGDRTPLARVGGEYLTLEEARASVPDQLLRSDSTGALRNYRDQWVRDRLMEREANRMGLHQSEEVRRRLEEARLQVLREALRSQLMQQYGESARVSDEEARNYYQAQREQFILRERYVRFRHLATATIEEARSARQDLLGGVEWPTVAQRYALEPEKTLEHSEQFWPVSMAAADNEAMHRYLEVIGISEISPIRRVGSSYHFVQLMESREAGEQPDLEWLMARIKEWLTLEKRRRYFSSYLKNLYLRAESNNEIETFNVLETNSNEQAAPADTIESNSPNE